VANLVEQNFAVATPNILWASDITYLPTAEGWLYLAVTLDLFSRKVVGWAFSDRLTDELTLTALAMAMRQRPNPATLTHHSDQGSQGGFNRSLQHSEGGVAWEDRRVGVRLRLVDRRCVPRGDQG
jgi:transposase InsO family protein